MVKRKEYLQAAETIIRYDTVSSGSLQAAVHRTHWKVLPHMTALKGTR